MILNVTPRAKHLHGNNNDGPFSGCKEYIIINLYRGKCFAPTTN